MYLHDEPISDDVHITIDRPPPPTATVTLTMPETFAEELYQVLRHVNCLGRAKDDGGAYEIRSILNALSVIIPGNERFTHRGWEGQLTSTRKTRP